MTRSRAARGYTWRVVFVGPFDSVPNLFFYVQSERAARGRVISPSIGLHRRRVRRRRFIDGGRRLPHRRRRSHRGGGGRQGRVRHRSRPVLLRGADGAGELALRGLGQLQAELRGPRDGGHRRRRVGPRASAARRLGSVHGSVSRSRSGRVSRRVRPPHPGGPGCSRLTAAHT